jgi:hypothetical protein
MVSPGTLDGEAKCPIRDPAIPHAIDEREQYHFDPISRETN